MWTGGGYGAGYNEAQELKEVTIPDDVKRVEFVAHITGHGMSGAMNCRVLRAQSSDPGR